MKYFLDPSIRRVRLVALAAFLAAVGGTISALAELPSWIRNIDAGSAAEAVFFRMMSLPSGAVTFRRPPRETRPALSDLIKSQPRNAELYSLRALEDEQALDFPAAEADWKAYLENSSDEISAQLRAGRLLPSPSPPRRRNQDLVFGGKCASHRRRKINSTFAAALLAGV